MSFKIQIEDLIGSVGDDTLISQSLQDIGGEIISAFQEERFTRIKFDPNFPINSINSCMDFADITINEFNCVAFYENPNYKLERLLKSYKNDSLLNIFQKVCTHSSSHLQRQVI